MLISDQALFFFKLIFNQEILFFFLKPVFNLVKISLNGRGGGRCFSPDEWQVVVKKERDVVYRKLFILFMYVCIYITVIQGVK